MKISKTVSALRNLIREHIRALNEGHGGEAIYYNDQTAGFFNALAIYSEIRKTSPPTKELMKEFLTKVNDASGPSQMTRSYTHIGSDKTSPVYKAQTMFDAATNAETIAQFGPPNFKLIEQQIMKVLGAGFVRKDDPSSGFDMFFGVPLNWHGNEMKLQNMSGRYQTF
jgi:hypothetical protein